MREAISDFVAQVLATLILEPLLFIQQLGPAALLKVFLKKNYSLKNFEKRRYKGVPVI